MVQSIDDARRRTSRPPGSRVPPHNLQAEESLLGAMLLSRDAIAAALEVCQPDDFYKPAYAHIYDAISALYAHGEPADPVTVADELRRAGLLDAIGGPPVLTDLVAATPFTGNAAHYAHIVEEFALLRRLIGVGSEITELGYTVPEDVAAAVDQAEAMVFDIAQRRVTDTISDLKGLLGDALDRLAALYERGESITGTPTGYLDLDERLSGLQPSALTIVGARPGCGKALALHTPIPTPDGWTTMGALEPGSLVFDDQGQPCSVTYASPVFLGHRCYEVRFDDGSAIVADADHRWLAYDYPAWKSYRERVRRAAAGPPVNPMLARDQSARVRHPRVVTTAEMVREGVRARDGRPNWYLPLAALDLPDRELPVDPYVLGCWLGDGCSSSSAMTLGVDDVLTRELHQVGLLRGAAKHIPTAYLRASAKQRLALLQGLMDTDGSLTESGVEICLSNLDLLSQVHELVRSLGHKPAPIRRRTTTLPDGRLAEAWRFSWTPLDPVFRLARRADALAARCRTSPTGRPSRRAIIDVIEVPSVPTRCIAVDTPSHLFLAGEAFVPTHNTSFALGMAAHAAVEKRLPVLFFSLEMSHDEVTQRLLSSEASVEATKLRNGKLNDNDWKKISHAIGRLSEAPLWIDDNPNLTVMEMRAKARRLKSRLGGLNMIVVDYLQLMSGRRNAENRQVEVSEISRGLKILARELEVPVVALSQLSRNLEMRADKRPMLADLRESGCLTAESRVLRSDTGAEVTMGELLLTGEKNIPVWSLDRDLKMVPATMSHVFPTGIKEVFDLRLSSGRTVRASANHPFLTVDGWLRVDELRPGSRIAVPSSVPEPAAPIAMPEPEVVMLAHLIGDGCMASRQPVHYTSADEDNVRAVEAAAAHFGVTPQRVRRGNWWHVYLPSPDTKGRRGSVQAWLEPMGLSGLRSHEVFIPRCVFQLPNAQVSVFLRHLWTTGGSLGSFGRDDRVHYGSSSRQLLDGIQQLLLRFGITSTISRVDKPGHVGFHLQVERVEHQRRFVASVFDTHGAHVPDSLHRLPRARARDDAGAGRTRGTGVATAADVLQDSRLRMLAAAEVNWERVVGIDAVGPAPVYDATVHETHNFIANGIVSENSLEQDADIVMFLYRDELYNPESPDRGTAEVIVAKHRSGPTGTERLAFLDRFTRFANMARV